MPHIAENEVPPAKKPKLETPPAATHNRCHTPPGSPVRSPQVVLQTPEATRRDADEFLAARGLAHRWKNLDPQQRTRLAHVLQADRFVSRPPLLGSATLPQNPTTFQEQFDKFCELVPVWRSEEPVISDTASTSEPQSASYRFWDNVDGLEAPGLLVLRQQLSGLCYMHAPVVVMHYVVYMATNGGCAKMINIGEFIRENLSKSKLERHILDNEGGDSVCHLKLISGANDFQIQTITLNRSTDVEDQELTQLNLKSVVRRLRSGRPALVSKFRVDKDFRDTDEVSFLTGEPDLNNICGRHAMVAIGHRVQDGEDIFLLQNWWKGRFFLEVSATYLIAADAGFCFLASSINQYPESLPVIEADFAETEGDLAETSECGTPEAR